MSHPPASARAGRAAWRALPVTLLLILAACAPTTGPTGPTAGPAVDAPALPADDIRTVRAPRDLGADDPLLRTAWEAWLRMELGRLQNGAYATEALLDLALPSGVRWTVVEYGPDAYELAITADATPTVLRVDPNGVHVRP